MRRVLVLTLLGSALIFLSAATPAMAQGIPTGSYQQTCNNVTVNGAMLVANCQDRNGNWRSAQLPDFQRCNGDIMNDNGMLRCTAAGGPYSGPGNPGYGAPGPYQGVNGPYGSVNGPYGSYVQTCQNVNVSGDDLHARCQRRDGSWHDTKLDDFNNCRGDIMNDNGKLRCVAGAYNYGYNGGPYPPRYVNGPGGSYTQSCTDIHVGGDDLHARCQTRDGDTRDAKLDDFRKCKSEIINDNGKLRCEK